jgi:hypothetical protein
MWFAFVFVQVLSAATLALAQAPSGLDPIKNFCSRIDHQSIV